MIPKAKSEVHVQRLKEALAQLEGFRARGVNAFASDFGTWKERTQRTLQDCFMIGPLPLNFGRLQFCEPRVRPVFGQRGERDEPEWLDMDQRRFDKDFAVACQLLADAIVDAGGSSDIAPNAATDHVTGLPNRAAFEAALTTALNESPTSVVMLDVDKFKAVNDTHGHPQGDAVLGSVARLLERVCAGKGSAYRYGGEEFIALLPNHQSSEAIAVAERARKELEVTETDGLRVTASFGVATLPEHAGDTKTLIECADKALYDAKNRGRNLVRVFGETSEPVAARMPERKAPLPDGITDDQAFSIRAQYFRDGVARCPRDDAMLDVSRADAMGRATPILLVHCGLCGFRAQL